MIYSYIFLLLVLLVATVFDIKSKTIPIILIIISLPICAILFYYNICKQKESLYLSLIAFIPGLLIIILNLVKVKLIGLGDGFLLIFCAACLTGRAFILATCFSLLLCSFYSIFLIAVRHANRKSTIPFSPFLLSGLICNGLLQISLYVI